MSDSNSKFPENQILLDNKQTRSNSKLWMLAAIFCTMLWGSATPMIKLGYAAFQMDTSNAFNIILFAGIRFFGAGFLTFLISYPLTKEKPEFTTGLIVPSTFLALAQTAGQYIFFYLGLAVVSGSIGSLLSSTNVFFTVLLTAIVLRSEKLTLKKIIAIMLGMLGIVILNLGGDFSLNFRLNGEGFVLLSAFANAIANILMRNFSQKYNPAMLTGTQFVIGGASLIVVGLLGGGRLNTPDLAGIAILFYLMLLSALAYGIWAVLLKNHPTSQVVIFNTIVPVFGAFFSWIILGENIWNWRTLVALIAIAAGILLANYQTGAMKKELPVK